MRTSDEKRRKKRTQCRVVFIFFLRYSSLARSAYYGQSNKTDIASYLKLTVQRKTLDEQGGTKNSTKILTAGGATLLDGCVCQMNQLLKYPAYLRCQHIQR